MLFLFTWLVAFGGLVYAANPPDAEPMLADPGLMGKQSAVETGQSGHVHPLKRVVGEYIQPENERPLKQVLAEIREQTGYRFLYLPDHVEGVMVVLEVSGEWEAPLRTVLRRQGLDLRVNTRRRQVVIFSLSTSGTPDHRMDEPERQFAEPTLVVAPGILVTGHRFSTLSDSLEALVLQTGQFNPLGEPNVIRTLQSLPSVGQAGSLSEGIVVRGTSDDAFQVLLDGVKVYNRAHVFGLVDSFNSDVIRTSALYYDVTPARYQGPPGGVLSLATRTGSLHTYGGTAAVSTSSVRASLDGPLRAGSSSWLLAGRVSLLNQMPDFGGDTILAWGMDTGRKSSLDQSTGQRVVTPLNPEAAFYDLHGKVYMQLSRQAQLTISGYSGFNSTRQQVDRLTRSTRTTLPTSGTGSDLFSLQLFGSQRFSSENSWGSNTFSTRLHYALPGGSRLTFTSGFSYYLTDYSREDFSYQRPLPGEVDPVVIIAPFRHASELNHGHFSVEVDPFRATGLSWGLVAHRLRTAYLEQSLNRNEFFSLNDSWMHEGWMEYIFAWGRLVELESGLRAQYFTNGSYFRVSPRLRLLLFPGKRVQLTGGYALTHQFMHKIGFYNAVNSDMWIQVAEGQPPTHAHTMSGGISARLWSGASIGVEGYVRLQHRLRLHEINIQHIERPLVGSPWYTGNEGFSQGVEVLFTQDLGWGDFMQTYTWSEARLRNPRIRNGEWFYASFDRRHQSVTTVRVQPAPSITASWSLFLASGVPDRLETDHAAGQERMGMTMRMDVSVSYEMLVWGSSGSGGESRLMLQVGVYNLTNRKNPWYSEAVQLISDEGPWQRLVTGRSVVYDLGFYPSASARITF